MPTPEAITIRIAGIDDITDLRELVSRPGTQPIAEWCRPWSSEDIVAIGNIIHTDGAVTRVHFNVDTPSPRCEVVKPGQRLQVVNALDRYTAIRFAHFTAWLAPRQVLRIDQPFGAYLAPGVHEPAISVGGGAELCYGFAPQVRTPGPAAGTPGTA